MTEIALRDATPGDAASLLAIYAPIVTDTVISFEDEPPSVDAFAARIVAVTERHAWLVAERGDEVVGYAYAGPHRERAAYRTSVETTAYVVPHAHRSGVGTVLYGALFERLGTLGYRSAFAGIALPNPASVALHERAGFIHLGTFPEVGWKFGAFHDVGWWYRPVELGPAA